MKTTSARLAAKALPLAPLALAALPYTAHAAPPLPTGIIYTDPTDVTVINGQIFIDMGNPLASPGTGDAASASMLSYNFSTFDLGFKGGLSAIAGSSFVGTSSSIYSFSSGAIIDSGSTFVSFAFSFGYSGMMLHRFSSSPTSFIGVRITDANSELHYGWVRVSSTANSFSVYDFAYNATANAPILAGEGQTAAIPEPSTYAALAGLLAGSAALYAKRRRAQLAA